MKSVCVILACYNGEKWIRRQIKSIMSQKRVKIKLFIFDDRSSDNTFKIIKKMSKQYKSIKVFQNKINTGSAAQNFLKIILKLNVKKYEYLSLADQDDIWEKNKIIRAIDQISKRNVSCYSSDVTLLFKNSHSRYLKKSQTQRKFDFLFEGGGPGSTFVLKREFVTKIKMNLSKKNILTKKIKFHDWYIYFYARINNYKWYIDQFAGLKYRQHENNELGANIGIFSKIKRLQHINNDNFSKQLNLFFKLNPKKKKNFRFLFNKNKTKTLWFIIKNFMNFRRKKTEQFICFLALLLILIRRKSLV